MNRDSIFLRFYVGIIAVVILYGVGMLAVIFWGDAGLARVMLTAFSAMFAGVLGFGSGYLIGKNGNGH